MGLKGKGGGRCTSGDYDIHLIYTLCEFVVAETHDFN